MEEVFGFQISGLFGITLIQKIIIFQSVIKLILYGENQLISEKGTRFHQLMRVGNKPNGPYSETASLAFLVFLEWI